jgi:hypothetical protein
VCRVLRIPSCSVSHQNSPQCVFWFEDSLDIVPVPDAFELLRDALHTGDEHCNNRFNLLSWCLLPLELLVTEVKVGTE